MAELPGRLTPVLIGYGHAGRDLHHRALRTLGGPGVRTVVCDPVRPDHLPAGTVGVPHVDALPDMVDLRDAVVHVTTPVESHVEVAERLAELGAARIIVEKPVARTVESAMRLSALAAGGVAVVPVSIWPSSVLTRAVMEVIASGAVGTVEGIEIEQNKPRFTRTVDNPAHRSAWEVEMPHQVLLALHLAGPVETLDMAMLWDMELPGGGFAAGMGRASLSLTHRSGITSCLISDLTAPTRQRCLTVLGDRGSIVAHYPVGSDDDVGHLYVSGRRRTLVNDRPLDQFLLAAYRHFADEGPPPPAGLDIHLQTIDLLSRAVTATEDNEVIYS